MNWSWMARIGGSRTVIAAAVAISVLLMGATVFVQQTIHEASDLVVHGMGGMLLRSVNEGIRRWDARSGPHTVVNRTILERLLNRHFDDGLRYIAIVDDEARVIVEAGEPSLQGLPADRRSVLRKRGRARLVRQVPPLRILDIDASLAEEFPDSRYSRRHRSLVSAYFVVFEFEPVAAQDLESRGHTVLVAAAVATLGILGLAWLFALALQARERLSAELEQKRRLATLGEMSAVLAHELRNPLASLKGHAQLLAEYLEDDAQLASKAHRVVGDAVRLENRMNDLLAFVRTGELERLPVHPDLPLRGAVAAVGSEMVDVHYLDGSEAVDGVADCEQIPGELSQTNGEQMTPLNQQESPCTSLSPNDINDIQPGRYPSQPKNTPIAELDSARLQQALENVLLNAVQVNPPEKKVQASISNENGMLRYRIRDYGPGIPTEELSQIFEPFVTTRTRGVGLGLAVTRRIIEAHGGKIQVENLADQGALFTLEIPFEQRAAT